MANSDKNIRITTSRNKTTFPNIVFTGSAAGSSVITLEVLDDNTVSFTSNEGQVFSLDSNLSTGTIWSVNDISGLSIMRASAGSTVIMSEFGGGVGIGITNPATSTYALHVRGQSAFASTNDTNIQFVFDTSAASGSNSLNLFRGNALRLYPSGSTSVYSAFKANASQISNATYTFPIAPPGTGTSFLQSDTSGNLLWVNAVTSVAVGIGLTTATAGPIQSTGTIRALRPLVLTFCAGFTPPVAGADIVVLRVPDAARDGTSSTTYILREFHIRVETPSAGSSRIQLEKSTGDGVFTAVNYLAGSGLTISGAGIYTTQTQSFAGSHVTSNDFLRLNWNLLSSTHANFSAYLELEEI